MPYSSLVARDIVLLCFPPVDAVFGEVTRRALDTVADPEPDQLEAYLRQVYPAAVVRERHVLASFGGPAWYVYRDGRYSPFTDERWWEAPETACILLGDDGRYLDANPAALELLGVDLATLRASAPGSFTVPTYKTVVPWILQLIQDTGELHSTTMLLPAGGGSGLPVEYRLVKDGAGPGRHVATLRRVPGEVVEVAPARDLALEVEGA